MNAAAELRRAGAADLARIAALEAACFTAGDGGFSRRQLRALLANPRAHWLIAGDAGAAACWLTAGNGRQRWARLYSLAVHPAARGRGLARHLLAAGDAWMARAGLATLRAEVKADNLAARRLYAMHGFREIARLPGYYAPGVDGIRLEKRLNTACGG
ncbi:MAG TPA: GNAT family N-acetyltransferase [Acidiferrobacterales bacterium]|jgi:ribosomal protein S18 acetylase RimI-like enzyme